MRISDWSSDVCSSDLCAFPRLSALARSADQLARIEQAGGIEACLHPAQRRQASGAVELGEQVAFQLSDAVFGRDRSPEFKDMAVDEAAGILAMRGQPRRSEERPVGKECVSTCRSRGSPYH